MVKVYEVYWIKLPEHKDIYNEGYVGITCSGYKKRFNQHVSDARNGSDFIFHRAIRKYGKDSLVLEVIADNISVEKALEMEEHFRPKCRVGWNTARGGDKPMDSDRAREVALSFKNNPNYFEIKSQISKRMWENPEHREMMSKMMKDMWTDEEFREDVISKIKDSWNNDQLKSKISNLSRARWEDEDYREYMSKCLKEHYNTPSAKKEQSERAKSSWKNPETRERITQSIKDRWADEDYKERVSKKISEASKAKYANIPWWRRSNNVDISVARTAGVYYDKWIELGMCGYVKLENDLGVKKYKLKKLVDRFKKEGWNPYNDKEWMEEFYEQRTTMD